MHRTDATDFEADIGNGNPGFKETPPGNETIVAANIMNAFQEEICKVIEDAGITLRATGAADAAALWGQLSPAISILAKKNGVIADASKYGMDPGGGLGVNIAALSAALAASRIVFIPAGTYPMSQVASTPVNVPEGSIIIGEGASTILQLVAPTKTFDIEDKNVVFQHLTIEGTEAGDVGLITNFTSEKILALIGVTFKDILGAPTIMAIDASSTVDGLGLIKIDDCCFVNITQGAIRMPSILGSDKSSRVLCRNSYFNNAPIVSVGVSEALRIFGNNKIVDGEITLNGDKNIIFEQNSIDIDNFFFNNTQHVIFRNNIFPGVLANTKNHNSGGNPSRVFFIGNTSSDGKTLDEHDNIRGIKIKQEMSGSQNISGSSSAVINFANAIYTRMATNSSYTKDTVFAAGVFTCKGFGNGLVRILSHVFIDNTPNNLVQVFLRINGVRQYLFNMSEPDASNTLYSIDTSINLSDGDTLDVEVDNGDSPGLNVIVTAAGINTKIIIEGL